MAINATISTKMAKEPSNMGLPPSVPLRPGGVGAGTAKGRWLGRLLVPTVVPVVLGPPVGVDAEAGHRHRHRVPLDRKSVV